MTVSIITITYNEADTLQDTIDSVRSQSYEDIEYVIKDGGSTDGTLDIVEQNQDIVDRWASNDDDGLFDALNEGIQMATGDIVGILHADDVFNDDAVVGDVVDTMAEQSADACWGDVVWVDRDDTDVIESYWDASAYGPWKFHRGWMPPHTCFFAKRELFEEYGYYDVDLNYAADYERMLEFLEVRDVDGAYVPRVLVRMRTGGVSDRSLGNITQIIKNQWDCYRAWRANGLRGGFLVPVLKPLSKLPQLFRTPPNEKL